MTSPRPDDHDGRRETGVAESALSDVVTEVTVVLTRAIAATPEQEPDQQAECGDDQDDQEHRADRRARGARDGDELAVRDHVPGRVAVIVPRAEHVAVVRVVERVVQEGPIHRAPVGRVPTVVGGVVRRVRGAAVRVGVAAVRVAGAAGAGSLRNGDLAGRRRRSLVAGDLRCGDTSAGGAATGGLDLRCGDTATTARGSRCRLGGRLRRTVAVRRPVGRAAAGERLDRYECDAGGDADGARHAQYLLEHQNLSGTNSG